MSAAFLILAAAAIAGAASHAIALFAIKRALLPDMPIERSSHIVTTPRSGGLAIFGGFASAAFVYFLYGRSQGADVEFAAAAMLGFAAFAFGAADDARPLGARIKFAAQLLIGLVFVLVYGAVKEIPAPFFGVIDLGVTGYPLTVLWIVAFMNAFNFMDGVNGIAGACGLFVLSALGVASAYVGNPVCAPAIFLAAAMFGFLPLNFPDGRLFMGDGGSQFAGFMIAAFAVLSGNGDSALSRMFIPIAFLPFIVDVTFTLIHRARRGCNLLNGHNEHVYQLLVRLGLSHQSVTIIYLTLVALSSAVAMAVNGISPTAQYAAAFALAAIYVCLGLEVYRRAAAADLLAPAAHAAKVEKPEPEKAVPAAAE